MIIKTAVQWSINTQNSDENVHMHQERVDEGTWVVIRPRKELSVCNDQRESIHNWYSKPRASNKWYHLRLELAGNCFEYFVPRCSAILKRWFKTTEKYKLKNVFTLVTIYGLDKADAVSRYSTSSVVLTGWARGCFGSEVTDSWSWGDRYRWRSGLRMRLSKNQGSARKSPVCRTAPFAPSVRNLG